MKHKTWTIGLSITVACMMASLSSAAPGTPAVNPLRSYPPSCAAYPLPDKATGPTWTAKVPMERGQGATGEEEVTVIVWRIPCGVSSDLPYNPGGGNSSMTVMRVERAPSHVAGSWVERPDVFAEQRSAQPSRVRIAPDPNTNASIAFGELRESTTYVLESFAFEETERFNFNKAFVLHFLPLNDMDNGASTIKISVPAYTPTPESYPAAFAPRALDGYAAAQWTKDDQGLLVQITEQYANGKMTRQLVFDLLTKDLDGNPWWLVGNAAFEVGTTSLDVDATYLGNNLALEPWGKVNFQMSNCGKLDVKFTPSAGLPAPVPTFSGLTSFGRLFDANGMVCQ